MAVENGSRFGPYQITATLGAGGMGEVYEAYDTRLGRSVAIKVLSAHLSGNETLRKRFLREARAISSLSHPNICALYDIGSDGGRDYLVMELLEGETLAQRLSRGPMPVDEALVIGMEIAAALDRAHRKGIVHRDLKPGNIMLTRSGAKLLDFGLARLADGAEGDLSGGPLSIDGGLIGTVEYMAPEQLSGGVVDTRTDIFSFGSVLYEMLTGDRPFQGENRASVIGAILYATPPPLRERRAEVPALADNVVQACLEKSPEDRIQSAHSLRRELEWVATGSAPRGSRAFRWGGSIGWKSIVMSLLAALALLGAGLGVSMLRWGAGDVREVRFTLTSPIPGTDIDWAVLSPDGKRLAFVAVSPDGTSSLWIRDLASTTPARVPDSDGAHQPFWSPDGTSLAFFASNKIMTFSPGSEKAVPIAAATAPRGGSWGRDGEILFAPHITTGLFATSSIGSTQRAVTTLSRADRDVSHRWPAFLPDGKQFLFVIQSRSLQRSGLYLGELGSDRIRKVSNVQSHAVVTADGWLLYTSRRALYRQKFDSARGTTIGAPQRIAEGVNPNLKVTGASSISAAHDGSMAWLSKPEARTQLTWVDRAGKVLAVLGAPRHYVNPALSPDGKSLAVSVINEETGRNSIDIIDTGSGVIAPFVADDANADMPIWSPDGRRIAYASDRDGSYDVFEREIGGVPADRLVDGTGNFASPAAWRNRGLVVHRTQGGDRSLWLFAPGGGPATHLLTSASGQCDLSPDARWLLAILHSEDTARSEVFLLAADDPRRRRQISTGGGSQPIWRGDGREFYYLDASRRLVAVSFTGNEVGRPLPLFASGIADPYYADHDYVPATDGSRFLINRPVSASSTSVATLVIRSGSRR